MSEKRLADQFEREVTAILHPAPEENGQVADLGEEVALAIRLAQVDLADESRVRASLRQRLSRRSAELDSQVGAAGRRSRRRVSGRNNPGRPARVPAWRVVRRRRALGA